MGSRLTIKYHYPSKAYEWKTPDDLFTTLDEEFHFTLDVCATKENTKCLNYFSSEENGLIQNWVPNRCWMNPPYGREIIKWMRKAYEENLRGALVVCLVPSRTDTRWWHNYVMMGEIHFLRGRLYFNNGKTRAPFPSAVVIFRPSLK